MWNNQELEYLLSINFPSVTVRASFFFVPPLGFSVPGFALSSTGFAQKGERHKEN